MQHQTIYHIPIILLIIIRKSTKMRPILRPPLLWKSCKNIYLGSSHKANCGCKSFRKVCASFLKTEWYLITN